ncbi:AsmA family protein [Maridesulfovibrio ferrireducens]|uniref:AsmA family protein n=1 Tax=Maridesulfovibrio ferrireducens TaxID=246191 RepID=UPI001A34BB87|nr:AsmA family protein [Maridesulfovibrio ferrireducens]MBI9112324.1 AsmA family protein [Maridesulfovibrio ferrireducens]
MSKPIKIIGIVVASLVVVVVAAMVLATIFINPNDYKDEISKIVRDKTGRELTFDGDIKLSVFPWVGVTTSGVTLSNAPGFSEKNMFSLKSADVSLKLLPLLSGDVQLMRVDVENLVLNLMRNKAGVTNWDDLVGKEGEKTKPESSADDAKSDLNITLGGLLIENAQIVWDDRKDNVRQAVDDCDISIDEFAPGEPFNFKVHVLLSSTKPEIVADTTTSGIATLSSDFKSFSVKDLKVLLDAKGAAVPGNKGQVKLSGDAALNLAAGTADVGNLILEAYDMKAEASFKGSGLGGDNLKFTGDMSVPGFNLKSTLEQMGIEVKTSSDKALTAVGLNFAVAGTAKSVAISNLLINLDETTIKGAASFANPDRPDVKLAVDVDKFNLDSYLPPDESGKADKKETKDVKSEKKGELFPVEFLRKLTLKADLSVKQLIAGKANLTNVIVVARAKGGVLTIKPLSLNAAKGAFTSTAVLNVTGVVPTMTFNGALTGLDGEALSQEMTGKDSFSGKMGFTTNLASRGNDVKVIIANLNGNLGFKVLDGYVSGFDILFLAGDAFSILTGGVIGHRNNNRTEFGEVSATAKIDKGVAVNKDLVLKSPLLRADGAGKMDLNTMTLDYALDAKIVGSLEGQGGKSSKDLVGLTVPVNITGAVADPSIMVDLPRFAVILAKSGFSIVGNVLEGVQNTLEGIGKTFTGKSGEKSTTEPDKNPVKKIGDTIKSLF